MPSISNGVRTVSYSMMKTIGPFPYLHHSNVSNLGRSFVLRLSKDRVRAAGLPLRIRRARIPKGIRPFYWK